MTEGIALGWKNRVRELRELGVGGSTFRILWEVKRRSGILELIDRRATRALSDRQGIAAAPERWRERLWFAPRSTIRERMGARLTTEMRRRLTAEALGAAKGELVAFRHEARACGNPIEWHRDPVTGQQVSQADHWSRAMAAVEGDVKDLWEMGRFAHAYAMVRAACFDPTIAPEMAEALTSQIVDFVRRNPSGRGVHWASGQEIAIRVFAWAFALAGLLLERKCDETVLRELAEHLYQSGSHLERHVEFARRATYNNHLLSEAAGLLLIALLLPGVPESRRWSELGEALFEEGVKRQFYADGGYIQQSHNYHRVALQDLLWGAAILRAGGREVPSTWRDAGLRSVDFLLAQMGPQGTLPNYGNNDGALISPLTCCEFGDFRPTLQAVGVVLAGQRVFESGAWDEEALWFAGRLPDEVRRTQPLRVASFPVTGHHVQRGKRPDTYAAFRCGTLLDRFTQMDMLHVDLHWRGHNVAADGGSYRYNGAPEWNAHFLGTAVHNTVTVDGENQMVHVRQFKMLYPTEAQLVSLDDREDWAVLVGEHYGYRRLRGAPIHRRAVLFLRDAAWVVVDTLLGSGAHTVRLHWLLGEFPFSPPGTLRTPSGEFEVAVFGRDGRCVPDVVVGREAPPRGWIARHYARRVAVPSLAVVERTELPARFVSVLGEAPLQVQVADGWWRVQARDAAIRFTVTDDGLPRGIELAGAHHVTRSFT